jgi:uncharacterized damage-inducible protein DinB
MSDLATIVELVRYGEVANHLVMGSVVPLSDEQLDRPLDLGMGSLRKICQHLLAGEVTWLARISGQVEAKWPAKAIPQSAWEMHAMFGQVQQERQALLRGLKDEQLNRMQKYRDSKGTLFQATVRQMLVQMITHATHHRAQAVNAIRRVGGPVPEVDYMTQVRVPAEG